MNLLKADLFHLSKDKVFWILISLTFLLPPVTCVMYNSMGTTNLSIQTLIFSGLGTDILCVIIGIALSSFIGKDYANNTIRNKICYGENKIKVALFYLLETVIITLLFIITSLISSFIFGLMFCEVTFTSDFVIKLLCQICIFIGFSSLISAIVISSKSTKTGFIATIIISVILSAVSYLFPLLAGTSDFAKVISRSLYMVVSNMVINGQNGSYITAGYTFDYVYLNALIMSIIYMGISVGTTLLMVRKQNYK